MTRETVLANVPTGILIDGEWREGSGGGRVSVDDPATGLELATVADATAADATAALDAAVAAQRGWAATPPRVRGEILRRAFELVASRSDEFASLMSLEMGKTVKEAKGEVAYGIDFFRWYSE